MSTIQPSQIFQVLDITRKIREQGGKYVPCMEGHSGIGKSETMQQWAAAQGPNFGFIDIRLAYMEGPDMVGMPQQVQIDGKWTTIHCLPDFLPKEGSGLLLFEEPNRAHESVMQTMMQILTDRKIHNYTLPEGWIMAAAINPEKNYNVNSMDAAVKSRFAIFDVNYHHNTFVEYMKKTGYNNQLIAFAESGLWTYKSVDEIGDEGIYVSPRSFSKMNDLMKVTTINSPLFYELAASVLGKVVASDLVKHLSEIRPVLWEDFERDDKEAFKRFERLLKGTADYIGDLTSLTVSSVSDAYTAEKAGCTDTFIIKLAKIIDLDQATDLLCRTISSKSKDELQKFADKNAKFWEYMTRRREGKEKKVA